ncbi:hypothetical protein GCM10020255_070700 [Rhodococcus baikonurensis]
MIGKAAMRTHQSTSGHAVAEPEADEGHDGKDGNDLQNNGVRIDDPLDPLGLAHQHAGSDADCHCDDEADQCNLRRHGEGFEHGREMFPVEQRLGQHLTRGREEKPAFGERTR